MSQSRSAVMRRVGGAALWVGAAVGLLSLGLAVLTVVAGVQPLIVQSASMEPSIGTGSLALARSVPAGDLEVGDIVSVTDREGRRVTHRVTAISRADGQVSLTLKGDANQQPDSQPYPVDDVDRVVVDIPGLGYVASWAAGPWGMFMAGLLVAGLMTSVLRRPAARGTHVAGAVAVVLGLGVVGSQVAAPVGTEAYFSDSAGVTAGAVVSHQLQAFDWAATPCAGTAAQSLTFSYLVRDPRYLVVFDRVVGSTSTRLKQVTPNVGTTTSTVLTMAELSNNGLLALGSYSLMGSTKLKGSGTVEWLSEIKREARFTILNLAGIGAVSCSTVNLGPALTFTKPAAGDSFANQSAADTAVGAACGNLAAPCGSVNDSNGIKSVQYRMQRTDAAGTQCWNPVGTAGFYLAGCGTWRDATTSPALPTTGSAAVTWRVPLGNASTVFAQGGSFTLLVRVTDNAGTVAVSEGTISFSRG